MFEKVTKNLKNKAEKTNSLLDTITIDVDVVEQHEDHMHEEIEEFTKDAKNALDYIKDELRERSAENKELRAAIKNEEMRLAAAREAAKNRNVLRKIKAVDNAYSKKEIARDTETLQKFKQAEQTKIDEARVQRTKEIASKNKKPIAVALAGLIAACGALGGITTHNHNVALAENYQYAVSCIMAEQYDEAKDTLYDLDYDDSDALFDYAYVQSSIDSYKGKPGEMLDDMPDSESVENEEVKVQYEDACNQLKLADEIQDDINDIKLSSAEDISKESLAEIEASTLKLDNRYKKLLSTDSYDLAVRVIENVENNTDAGQLMADINSLGEVSLESKGLLDKLRSAYDSLSADDKKTILNYNLLTSAESTYSGLRKKEDERIAAEKKAEEERIEAERLAAEKKAEEERIAAEAAAAAQEQLVWISASGKCYHSKSTCSNMKNPWQVTLSEAERRNKRACSKCF